ncbi:M23 family metallopeptidase [Pseudomonas sp. KB-10]|uniref:peptidoglycan DD-metalloendopeptidase family protein n=1 Tax=Pseudomonas sp. KB-10 TaxID=2292264 RepID=UPI001BAE57D0|nr:M23 family metallopeptidase [Pseudomonas sp. KB-10]
MLPAVYLPPIVMLHLPAIALLTLLITTPLQAANFYKFVDDNGVVTYGNRPPAETTNKRSHAPPADVKPRANQRHSDNHKDANRRLQALLQQDILRHVLENADTSLRASPAGGQGYRYALPWKSGRFPVTQGAEGGFSHNTPQSRYALDIAMPVGTPLYAARGGTVTRALNIGNGANGSYLRIAHGDGSSSAYLHLQEGSIVVQAGQRLKQGDYLGRSGNTGRSTGPHLHFVVQVRSETGYRSIPFVFNEPLATLPNFADMQP